MAAYRGNKQNLKFADLDIETLFDDYVIEWKESGKNIGRSFIGVESCPFCGRGNFHFGIHKYSKVGSCWSCGETGNPVKYLSEMLGMKWKEVYSVIEKYSDGDIPEFKERMNAQETIVPSMLEEVDKVGLKYLKDRGFDEYDVEEFQLGQLNYMSFLRHSGHEQDFRWRIFIPIYMNRRLVSYTARDYTGKGSPKYQHPLVEATVIPAAGSIFNYDKIKKFGRAVILEGPMDSMKMGDNSCSMQGVTFTTEQLMFLEEKQLKEAYVCFDDKAKDKAERLANALGDFIPCVRVVTLRGHDDVGEMSKFDALKMKMQLISGG